jgi:hypothetical protein
MRDIETIDGELRLVAVLRRSLLVEHGIEPSSRHVDELLDERLVHRSRADQDTGAASSIPKWKPLPGTIGNRMRRAATTFARAQVSQSADTVTVMVVVGNSLTVVLPSVLSEV